MKRRRMALVMVALIAFGLVLANAATRSLHAGEDDNVIESFDVERNGDLLLVPVTIGEQVHKFVLDTGSSTTVFHTSLKSALTRTGRTIRLANTGTQVDLYECRDAVIGASRMPLAKWATCCDLSKLAASSGWDDIEGILGMDFLKLHILQLDFDAGRVRFLRSSLGAPSSRANIHFSRVGLPMIAVEIPDLGQIRCFIDTGNVQFNNGRLPKDAFDALVRRGSITEVHATVTQSIGGSSHHREGTVARLSVAGFEHRAQMFDDGAQDVGSLSLGYLSRFTATFDFPDRALYLAKGKQFDRTFPMNTLGLDAYPYSEGLLVVDVDPDSRGAKCGIEYGHQIVEIDGRPTKGCTLYASRMLLNDPPEGTRLKIRESAVRPPFEIRLVRGPAEPPARPAPAERMELLRAFLRKMAETYADSAAANEAMRLLDKD